MKETQAIRMARLDCLEKLLAGLAHEIGNADNLISLNVALLRETWQDAVPILDRHYEENGDFNAGGLDYTEMRDDIPALFAGISDGVRRIEEINRALRGFAVRENEDAGGAVDLNAAARGAVALCGSLIRKTAGLFEAKYDPGFLLCNGDLRQIQQVVIHLIQSVCSALKTREEPVRLSTSFDPDADAVLVEIEAGRGDLLQAMRSAGGAEKSDAEERLIASDAGLAAAVDIVRMHGGSFASRSVEDGGVAYSVSFPAAETR